MLGQGQASGELLSTAQWSAVQLKVQLDSYCHHVCLKGPLTTCQHPAVPCCKAETGIHDDALLATTPAHEWLCLSSSLLRLRLCLLCSVQHLGWLLCKAEWMGVPSSNPAVGAAFTICELQRWATSPRSRPEIYP